MSRKLFISIVVAVFLCMGVVVHFSSDSQSNIKTPSSKITRVIDTTPGVPQPQTDLRLVPNPARPDSLGMVKLNVAAITNQNKITSVHFIVTYDPTVLDFEEIEADDSFINGTVTIKKIDQAHGRIEFAETIKNGKKSVMMQGNDHVADIEFKPLRYSGKTPVTITGVTVDAYGISHSVLKNSLSTIVDLTK